MSFFAKKIEKQIASYHHRLIACAGASESSIVEMQIGIENLLHRLMYFSFISCMFIGTPYIHCRIDRLAPSYALRGKGLRIGQIQLVHIQVDLDMLLCIEFGQ